jgi:hypothetical protein
MKTNQASRSNQKQTDNSYSAWLLVLVVFFLTAGVHFQSHSQVKSTPFSIHAGINRGILSGGVGPSLSFQYTHGTEKLFQFQSNLFFDYHSGKTFLSGYNQQNKGFGIMAGLRINLLHQNTWYPSLTLLPGVMYSSESTSRADDPVQSGWSGVIGLGISNTFFHKHSIGIGLNTGAHIQSIYLTYGFWF